MVGSREQAPVNKNLPLRQDRRRRPTSDVAGVMRRH